LEFDRGHLAPLASFKGSVYASEVNYYSNITPQAANLNRGPWRELEERVRNYVKRGKTVWVTTGPLYESQMAPPRQNTDEPHRVPSAFWKVVLAIENSTPRAAAFIMDQGADRNADVTSFVVTVDEVEQRTNLELMPQLEDTNIEAATDAGWLLQ